MGNPWGASTRKLRKIKGGLNGLGFPKKETPHIINKEPKSVMGP